MNVSEKSSKWIAVGVLLCIWCPIFLIFCGGIDDSVKRLSDGAFVLLGLVPLFIMIGIAVGIFIYHGTKLEKFEWMKKEKIQMDAAFEQELAQIADEERSAGTIKIIIGVIMCIFSVIPLLVTGSISDNVFIHVLSMMFLLMIIGIAVAIMIIGGNRMECIKILRQEGEYSVRKKESNKIVDVIAGVYWPIVVVIYLAWSFTTGMWGYTWIVWPIAGVLFGAIAVICEVVSQAIKKSA